MRRLLVRLALLAASLVLALGLAELALRAFPGVLPEQTRLRLHWAGLGTDPRTSVAHPTIGTLARPGLAETLERSDLSFRYTIDPNGFRNPWPWPAKADVVVTGDSLAFGYGVDDGQGWADLVRRRTGLALVNLGITGAAPQMGLAAWEAFGAPLAPALLVFGLFPGNDVYDARMFERWQASGAGGNFGVWRATGGRGPSTAGSLYGWVYRTFVYHALRGLARHERQASRTLALAGGGSVQLVPDVLASAVVPSGSEDFQRVVNAALAAARSARERGAHALVLFFPTKEEVYLPLAGEPAPDAIGPFRAALEGQGVETLDPTPALRALAAEGRQVYFTIDGHPNAAGYEAIAGVVEAHLRANAARYGLPL